MKIPGILGVLLLNLVVGIASEKILFLLPMASKSHKNVFQPLIQALGDRKHQVTVASPVPPAKTHPNIREIVPVPYEELFQQMESPFELRKKSKLSGMSFNISILWEACEKIYDNKDFLQLANQKFDLVILNGFINDCVAGMVHSIGAPLIVVSTIATPSFLTEHMGNSLPYSFVPIFMVDFGDEMSLYQRAFNGFFDLLYRYYVVSKQHPPAIEIYRRRLGNPNLPSVNEILGNTSLILSNSYFPLNYPRPLLPDVVEVGGMHCREAQPLPKDMEDFLSGAEHGFILFSMGSILRTDQMPEETRQIFLNVFSRLKQRVLWKWNSGHMDNLPSNIMLSKWVPQQDVLGHPKIRLFMSHGGLLSTQEASYHGVPIIGIPMFGDQDLNVNQAVMKGYAVMLEILDLTEERLEESLKTVLNTPSYTRTAKTLSAVLKDQPQTPIDRAVFWTEYVIRHKGAPHLRSAARKLNFFQYHFLDVISLVLIALGLVLGLLIALVRFTLRKCCGRKKAASNTDKKKTQ